MRDGETKTGITAEEILSEDLYGVLVRASTETRDLSPAAVTKKIRAAEDFYEHSLNLFFEERRVASDPTMRPGGALPEDAYDVAEPAYDYPRDFFLHERNGYLDFRTRPVWSVSKLFFAFNGSPGAVFDFQKSTPAWTRLDTKYGRLYLDPPVNGSVGPLGPYGGFFLSRVAGGHGVPQSLYIDYVAGFGAQRLRRDHMDLLEGVRLRTLLLLFGILGNVRSKGLASQSLSEDGLSRSQSPQSGKWGPYSGAVELAIKSEADILDAWKRSERGIPMVVC